MSFESHVYRRPFLVSVEGNIGAGKSTFLEVCDATGVMDVCPEPVNEWRSFNGVNVLSQYYEDPKTWGMSLQMMVNMTKLRDHVLPKTKEIRVVVRTLSSARHCFVEIMRPEGQLNSVDYHILQQWYDFNEQFHRTKPDMIVYLRTTPLVAYQRMRERSHSEEDTVKLEYLQKLHEQHEEWLGMEMQKHKRLYVDGDGDGGTYVSVIEADRSLYDLEGDFQEACSNIYWASEGGL